MSIPQGKRPLSETHPHLSAQWSSKNTLSPDEVTHGSHKKVRWICEKGHEWEAEIASRTSMSSGCPYCSGRLAISGVNDFATLYPDLVSMWSEKNIVQPTEVSANSSKKYLWKCLKNTSHEEWLRDVYGIVNGSRCPQCSGRKRVSGINDFKTKYPLLAAEMSPTNSVDPSAVGYGSHKIVEWVCSEGHKWRSSIKTRVSNNVQCPICSNKKVLEGFNDLATTNPELAKQWSSNNTLKPTEVTYGSGARIEWICPKNKSHSWEAKVADRKWFGCPKCSHTVSSQEIEISTFLQLHGISPGDILLSNRKIIPPKELDIYLPSHNLAIEFNGLYWHTEEAGKGPAYHLNKHTLCAEKGIQLLTIWEDDWRDRRPIVERMIKEKLKLSDERRVAARKTEVVPLTRQEITSFMHSYHIQGSASGSYYLGLKEKGTDNLVAAMILTRRGDVLTLDRYATSCNVPGGHSKLIAYVQREVDFSSLVTFADLCISNGDLYEKTGWTRDSLLQPDYRYIYNGKRVHKFNFRKKRFRDDPDLLWDERLTERQLAELNGLPRVWDCGKIRYIQEKRTK